MNPQPLIRARDVEASSRWYQLTQSGIYFGMTGGQAYCSPDGGNNWTSIAAHLPVVLSVKVQTLR